MSDVHMLDSLKTESEDLKRVLARVSSPIFKDLVTPLVSDATKIVRWHDDDFELSTGRIQLMDEAWNRFGPSIKRYSADLWNEEKHEYEKGGPASWRPNTDKFDWIGEQLSGYFDSNVKFSPNFAALSKAQDKVYAIVEPILSSSRFMPLDEVPVKPDRFSGLPFLTRYEKCADEEMKLAKWLLERVQSGMNFDPMGAVSLWRGQPKSLYGKDHKDRLVWGEPKHEVIVGLAWLKPLLPKLAQLPEFVGLSTPSAVDAVCMRMLGEASNRNIPIYSGDYSQYDSTVFPELTRAYFERMPCHKQLLPLFDAMFTSPIYTPSGKQSGRTRGVPSGHAWTNFMDSLGNLTAIYYVGEVTGTDVLGASVLGDDSIFSLSEEVPVQEVSDIMAELGLKLSADKTIVSPRRCHFLRKVYLADKQHGGIRSIMRTLNSMITLERWTNEASEMYHVARWWMQLDEIRFHPLREDFLKFILEHDRTKLGYGREAEVERTMMESPSLSSKNDWRNDDPVVPSSFWFRNVLPNLVQHM